MTDKETMTAAMAARLRQEFVGLLSRPARVGLLTEAGEQTAMAERETPAAAGEGAPVDVPPAEVAPADVTPAAAGKTRRTRQAAARTTISQPAAVSTPADSAWF